MESGISFCPGKSVRFGRRDSPKAGRSIDFSNVMPSRGISSLHQVSPREESNPYLEIRNLVSYPLNDEGVLGVRTGLYFKIRNLMSYPLNDEGVIIDGI